MQRVNGLLQGMSNLHEGESLFYAMQLPAPPDCPCEHDAQVSATFAHIFPNEFDRAIPVSADRWHFVCPAAGQPLSSTWVLICNLQALFFSASCNFNPALRCLPHPCCSLIIVYA